MWDLKDSWAIVLSLSVECLNQKLIETFGVEIWLKL